MRGERGIAAESSGVTKKQFRFKLLDLPVYKCVYQQKRFVCVCVCVYVQTSKELLSCVFIPNFPSLQTSSRSNPLHIFHAVLFFIFSLFHNLSLLHFHVVLARGEAGIISYTWRGVRCGNAVMQASAQGFCVQKIQLKNNYQKISGSPVRLYCLNRCFLFICCNNRMLFN